MTRFQFIAELRARLVSLTNDEREAAIKFYDEYFDDAGEDNEQNVINTLESPEKLAKQILSDYNKTEKASSEYVPIDPNKPIEPETPKNNSEATTAEKIVTPKKQMSGGEIALIVVLCVIFSPAIIGLLAGAFGILVGIFSTIFGLYIAFASIVFSFIVAGVACIIGGFAAVVTDPVLGLGLIGVGLLVGGIGLFLLVPFIWVTTKAIPAICRGLLKAFSWPFRKISGRA